MKVASRLTIDVQALAWKDVTVRRNAEHTGTGTALGCSCFRRQLSFVSLTQGFQCPLEVLFRLTVTLQAGQEVEQADIVRAYR